jgi:lambda repressor-like predicted transcriptional regulator
MQQGKNNAAYREACTGDAQDFHRREIRAAVSKKCWNLQSFRTSGGMNAYFFLA